MVTSGPHHSWTTVDDWTCNILYFFTQVTYWTQNYEHLNVFLEPDVKEVVYCCCCIVLLETKRNFSQSQFDTIEWQIEIIRGSALIGCGVRPMGTSVCAETIVRRVVAESRLFLVGPALPAISVSGRAEGRGWTGGGRTFLFTDVPPPPTLPPLALCIRPLTTLVEFTITAAEAFSPSGMHLKVDYLQEFGLGVFLKTIRC